MKEALDALGTKSAEQSDENFLRYKSFKEGKEKVIGGRLKVYYSIQEYFDGEMQGFVGGIGHNETKKVVLVQTVCKKYKVHTLGDVIQR